jgi:MoxR-like ATPase
MAVEQVRDAAEALTGALARVVLGQDEPARQVVTALLTGGHVLLEGPPGLGKTLLVRTLSDLVRADFRRIQFTPDLMPSDIVGTTIFRPQTGAFEFLPGPIFTGILLADEINRTPPKTQAALLEAMQEGAVTLDGARRVLPDGFFVAATQNPVEFEGTYPLPEAQLDRFLMKIRVGYPTLEEERKILDAHAGGLELLPAGARDLAPILDMARILELRRDCAAAFVEDSVRDYIVRFTAATRSHPRLWLGASHRAAVSLMHAAKTAAAMAGRDFVLPDDVKSLAGPVLRHRLILRPESELDGIGPDEILAELLRSVELPRASRAS